MFIQTFFPILNIVHTSTPLTMQVMRLAEASLVAVGPLLGKLRNKIRHVDAEILSAVRLQVRSSSSFCLSK